MEVREENGFIAYLKDRLPLVEDAMATYFQPQAADNADLQTYLYKPLCAYTKNAGKRTRPIICLLGCEACFGDIHEALRPACAIENFQTAALIHDDIADQGEMRRGEPCMHLTQGTGLAINCGDLALASVFGDIICHPFSDPYTQSRLLQELFFMTSKTIEGQALDLGWVRDGRWDLCEKDYFTMATLKTAHYSCASPLVCGAIVAGASQDTCDKLREFGLAAGLAFQIQDDYLNIFGDKTSQGKDFMSDLVEGKRTLLVVYALTRLCDQEKQELIQILDSHTTETKNLMRAAQLLEESGARLKVCEYADELVTKAKQALASASIDEDAKTILVSMADYFIARSK